MASGLTTVQPAVTQLEQSFWVGPATPVPASKAVLPAPDQVGIPIVLPRICCFRRDATLSDHKLITALQVATSGAIAELPHLLGKITLAPGPKRRFQLEIEENATVLVKIKHHPEKSAEYFERRAWAPHLIKREELTLSKYPIPGVGTYNFAVQANLIRGGVILAIHMSHLHFDGYAHALIELVFAHHLRQALLGRSGTNSGIVVPSALDKSVAHGTHPARPILEWEDWRPAPPPADMSAFSPEELMQLYVASMANFSLTIWRFTPEQQERMRREFQDPEAGTNGKKKLSLASCLHSYLWKAITRARELDPDQETRCLTPVQTRGRVKEMHENWSGSALVYSRAKATAAEVQALPTHALGRRLEAGVSRWTPARIREYWGSIEDCADLTKIQPNTDRQNGPDVEFSNIANLPYHRIDWGQGLEVAAWRATELAFTDGYVIISPRLRNGNLEAFMYLNKDTLANLLADPEFRARAEYVAAADAEVDVQVAQTQPAPRAKL